MEKRTSKKIKGVGQILCQTLKVHLPRNQQDTRRRHEAPNRPHEIKH